MPNPWVPSHYHYLVRAGAACQTRAYQHKTTSSGLRSAAAVLTTVFSYATKQVFFFGVADTTISHLLRAATTWSCLLRGGGTQQNSMDPSRRHTPVSLPFPAVRIESTAHGLLAAWLPGPTTTTATAGAACSLSRARRARLRREPASYLVRLIRPVLGCYFSPFPLPPAVAEEDKTRAQKHTCSGWIRRTASSAGDMAEEKGALQSAREWVVDHKLRAVGNTTSSSPDPLFHSPPIFHARLRRRSRGGIDGSAGPFALLLQGRCGSAASSAPSPTTGPGRA